MARRTSESHASPVIGVGYDGAVTVCSTFAKDGKIGRCHAQDRTGHLVFRGERVMVDADLAVLCGVTTKALNQAVRRNRNRFPVDFMFQLTLAESRLLRSQRVTSNDGRGGRRYAPYAFTEQGVAMLSTVLRSPSAIHVNIEIMRTFVRLRAFLAANVHLARRLQKLEKKTDA